MSDLSDIANFALDYIGQTNITSLNDSTQAAEKVNLHIKPAIREVLQSGKWKCARKLAQLSQLTAAPLTGYAYQYQLPGDYLAMYRINDTDPATVVPVPYDINGTLLLTDDTPVYLTYIADLSMTPNDIGAAPQHVVNLFALTLAVKLAWFFQQAGERQAQLIQMLEMAKRKAVSMDSRETRPTLVNQICQSNWVTDRQISTNG